MNDGHFNSGVHTSLTMYHYSMKCKFAEVRQMLTTTVCLSTRHILTYFFLALQFMTTSVLHAEYYMAEF